MMRKMVIAVACCFTGCMLLSASERLNLGYLPSKKDEGGKQEMVSRPVLMSDGTRIDSILASVNGDPVSMMDVLYESRGAESRLYLLFSGKQLYEEIKKTRKKILDDIIARKLLVAEYERKAFTIPEDYVERMLDDLVVSFGCSTRAELAEKANQVGTNLAELRKKAKEKVVTQMMVNTYFYTNINLTPKDLYEYYEKHKDEFSTTAQVRLEILFLRKDRGDLQKVLPEIKNDCRSGNAKIFHSLVKLHSDGQNTAGGGDVGWIERKRLRQEFARALAGARIDVVVGPVETDEGIYFIRVAEEKKAEIADFRKVENELRTKLETRQKTDGFNKYIEELKQEAIIRYYL